MSTAARVAAYRRRKREGRILLHFEVSQQLTDNLIEAQLLSEWDAESPSAIAAAIIKLLEALSNDVT